MSTSAPNYTVAAAEVATRLRRRLTQVTGGLWILAGPDEDGRRLLRDNAGRYLLTVYSDGSVDVDARDRHGALTPSGYLRPLVDPTAAAVLATSLHSPPASTEAELLAERFGDVAATEWEVRR